MEIISIPTESPLFYYDGNYIDTYGMTPFLLRGIATNYAYNLAGDLLAVDYADADATPDVLYSYTRTGQQDEVKDGQFATTPFTAGAILATTPTLATTRYTYDYAYNSRFQVETETVKDLLASDAVLTRTYQDGTETNGLIGRVKGYSLSAPSAISAVNYTYDTAGRLSEVSDGTDDFKYGYLANTRNLLETMEGPVHTTTYSYESGRNAMTGIENKETVGNDSVVSNYAYTYNALGQRADREQSGSAFTATTKDTFTYDDLGQVTASANDTETGRQMGSFRKSQHFPESPYFSLQMTPHHLVPRLRLKHLPHDLILTLFIYEF